MPRFVVLQHEPGERSRGGRHWDLMLEHEGALRTWALEEPPDQPGPIAARRLADHRLAYLDYEGEISGGRGSVTRWDGGEYEVAGESELEIAVAFRGTKLQRTVRLTRQSTSADDWTFELA